MSTKSGKSRGLGRGLSALMADVTPRQEQGDPQDRTSDTVLPVEKLYPNPNQPRRRLTRTIWMIWQHRSGRRAFCNR